MTEKEKKAEYYFDKAGKAYNRKDYKTSITNLEKTIKLNPNYFEAYYNFAHILTNHFQEYKKAKQYYEKAIKIDQNNAGAYNNLAVLLSDNFQEYEKAKQYYEKAIKINPDNSNSYYNLANILTNHFQEHEKAKQYYEKAIEINPNDAEAYNNLAKLLKEHFKEDETKNKGTSGLSFLGQSEKEDKINFIEIKNFKILKNLKIDLSEKVNIILAKNGFGKTTFLQALTFANIPDKIPLEDKNKIDSFSKFLSFNKEKATIVFNKNNKDIKLSIDKYEKKTEKRHEFEYLPIYLVYGVNIFTRYEEYNYDNIIDELINGAKENYTIKSIFTDFEDTFYDPLIILNKLSDKKKSEISLIKDFIIDKINQLIPDYKIVTKEDTGSHYFISETHKQDFLTTKDLSEGYRSAIILLSDIIIRILAIGKKFTYESLEVLFKKITGIVAIDEFDRHLHPSWQRFYVNNLIELLPEIQFVLTTHNPVAILGRTEDEVQELYFDKKNNLLKIRKLPETESIDAGTILLKHFGISSILSVGLQNKIDKYYEIKSKENLNKEEQKQLKSLEAEITNSDVNVNIHDYRFLIFIKFLKKQGYDTRERLQEIILTKEEIEELEKEFENYESNI